jgi:tetratricopeptide (TPR) repeat protein
MIRMRLFQNLLIAAALTGAAAMSQASAMSINSPQGQTADPAAPPKSDAAAPAPNANPAPPDKEKAVTKKKKPPEKKSERLFIDGYRHAYDLVYHRQNYADAIATLRALGRDDHPDVANLIGFSSRKLGRTEDAKVWYEKALAADPEHTRTWQYYGMWHLEQGDREKAEQYLERIGAICGRGCEEYASLRDALDGNITY